MEWPKIADSQVATNGIAKVGRRGGISRGNSLAERLRQSGNESAGYLRSQRWSQQIKIQSNIFNDLKLNKLLEKCFKIKWNSKIFTIFDLIVLKIFTFVCETIKCLLLP